MLGWRRRISWAASMPSMWWVGGIRMSVMTASGCSSSTCSQQRLRTVDRGDDLELAAELEDGADALAVHLVVLGDHHPQRHAATVGASGSSATTIVPPVGLASTVTVAAERRRPVGHVGRARCPRTTSSPSPRPLSPTRIDEPVAVDRQLRPSPRSPRRA